MKILYCVTKGNWGGAQRYVFDLATNLPPKEFECAVAAGEGDELKKRLREAGIRVIPLSGFDRDLAPLRDLKTLWQLIRLFRRERPDIVHLNSSKAGGLGALAGRLARVPRVIFTAHGFAFNEDRPFWQRCIIFFATLLIVSFAHKTICVSISDARGAARWPFIGHKCSFIALGIAPATPLSRSAARRELEARLKKPNGFLDTEHLVGAVAELVKNKGLTYAVAAMKQVPNARCLIIGSGEEKIQLQREIRTAGLEERVFLVGYVPDAARIFTAFDCLLIPSLKEGLPYALLEAGRAGLPVIASAVGNMPLLITHRETGLLVSPKQASQIALLLSTLLADDRMQNELGSRLKEAVEKWHTLTDMITQTRALYSINQTTQSRESHTVQVYGSRRVDTGACPSRYPSQEKESRDSCLHNS